MVRVVADAVLAAEFRGNRLENRVHILAECGLGDLPQNAAAFRYQRALGRTVGIPEK